MQTGMTLALAVNKQLNAAQLFVQLIVYAHEISPSVIIKVT